MVSLSRTQSIGDQLRLQARLIAERTVQEQYDRDPALLDRYGQSGRVKCADDIALHVLCLADSVDANAPEIFQRYLAWSRSVMKVHGVEDAHILQSIEFLADAVESAVPDGGSHAARFARGALRELTGEAEEPPCEIVAGRPHADLAQKYLAALLQRWRTEAIKIIADAKLPLRDVFLHVLTPAQREIGRLWQLGKIDVSLEHYCTTATRDFMVMLGHEVLRPPAKNLTIVGAGVSQELHEMGLRMVCDLFEYEGWRSIYIGANTPDRAILTAIEREKPDIVALSATAPFFTYRVQALIPQVRQINPKIRVMVGGNAFNGVQGLWKRIGADSYAPDADSAIRAAYALLGRQ